MIEIYCTPLRFVSDTYLSLLLVEVVDDDADEEVEGEEGAEDDEDDEVEVHVEVDLSDGLLLHLETEVVCLSGFECVLMYYRVQPGVSFSMIQRVICSCYSLLWSPLPRA